MQAAWVRLRFLVGLLSYSCTSCPCREPCVGRVVRSLLHVGGNQSDFCGNRAAAHHVTQTQIGSEQWYDGTHHVKDAVQECTCVAAAFEGGSCQSYTRFLMQQAQAPVRSYPRLFGCERFSHSGPTCPPPVFPQPVAAAYRRAEWLRRCSTACRRSTIACFQSSASAIGKPRTNSKSTVGSLAQSSCSHVHTHLHRASPVCACSGQSPLQGLAPSRVILL